MATGWVRLVQGPLGSIDDDWVLAALRARINVLTARHEFGAEISTVPLVYKPRSADPAKNNGAASLSVTLTTMMREARIYVAGRYRVESIREYLACRIFDETGSLEKAAVRLGTSSLDSVAHIVGFDWAGAERLDDPPPSHRTA